MKWKRTDEREFFGRSNSRSTFAISDGFGFAAIRRVVFAKEQPSVMSRSNPPTGSYGHEPSGKSLGSRHGDDGFAESRRGFRSAANATSSATFGFGRKVRHRPSGGRAYAIAIRGWWSPAASATAAAAAADPATLDWGSERANPLGCFSSNYFGHTTGKLFSRLRQCPQRRSAADGRQCRGARVSPPLATLSQVQSIANPLFFTQRHRQRGLTRSLAS